MGHLFKSLNLLNSEQSNLKVRSLFDRVLFDYDADTSHFVSCYATYFTVVGKLLNKSKIVGIVKNIVSNCFLLFSPT